MQEDAEMFLLLKKINTTWWQHAYLEWWTVANFCSAWEEGLGMLSKLGKETINLWGRADILYQTMTFAENVIKIHIST